MSDLNVTSISNLAGTGPATLTGQSAAKSWCNINGTASPASLRESFNVSSLTDVGTGSYRPSYTSNMSTATYAPTNVQTTAVGRPTPYITTLSTDQMNYTSFRGDTNVAADAGTVCISISGDLA